MVIILRFRFFDLLRMLPTFLLNFPRTSAIFSGGRRTLPPPCLSFLPLPPMSASIRSPAFPPPLFLSLLFPHRPLYFGIFFPLFDDYLDVAFHPNSLSAEPSPPSPLPPLCSLLSFFFQTRKASVSSAFSSSFFLQRTSLGNKTFLFRLKV